MKRNSVSTGAAGRQSMQALRSQDFNKQGLYTPQTKERPNFGKLNTSRLTPGTSTSERKISFFGKRTSGPGSRNSLLGVFGGTEKIKDPRPLNDKTFIQQYIRQLCEFLTENGYACGVSMKSLQSPSVKDFLKIFTFIFDFLSPSYELPDSKFEEEVPRILKDLGYPFTLPKSSMYTVGAPHTWPHVVAGLNWLIDCVKLIFASKQNSPSFDDGQPWGGESEDGIMHNKLFLDYTVKCYENFMTGADSFEDLDTELHLKLKDLFNIDDSKLESLALENKRLTEEIARLEREKENEPNRLISLRKLKASLKADVQKYQAYMNNLESHSSILDQKLSGLNEEVPAVELELEAVKQENARLQSIIDIQKYSIADIERIHHERNEFQQTIKKLTTELETEQKQLWNEELKYARSKEAIEAQLAEYHKLARKLKLIPKSAENSKGYDFEIKFNPEAGTNYPVKYRTQVYIPLKELLNQYEEGISNILHKKMGSEETLEQVNTMVKEVKRSTKMLNDEVQKLKDLKEQKIKEAEEKDRKCTTEVESLDKHKHLLESGVNEGLSEAMSELDDIQQQYQLVLQMTTEERRKVSNNLQRLLEMVATHVGSIEKHLEDQIVRVDRECEEFIAEDFLENIKEVVDKYQKKASVISSSE
ncbi:kinetochore protein NDC80 homolog isoform X1 [Trichosurus vulpecula]|uniref:kinetochore protein NDC80 homolog isoform X1 n=1 Tax=Trichosurus vulpecula TaxID=9337 RepID=UPI00186B4CEE|nr:kinetochore protein NDC80 homolog isoform X1 [Trichosurus vulpecula]